MTPGVCVEAFFSGGAYNFAPVLTGLVSDYNVNTAAIAAGWDGVRPLIARITVSVGCVVYGSVDSAGAAAMWVPGTFPASSSITIVRLGTIIGRGGLASGGAGQHGRDGLRLQYPTRLEGAGLIAGGGGAGGEGQTMTVQSNVGLGQFTGSGGSPGRGAGYNGAVVGSVGSNGSTSGASDQSVTGGRGGDGGGPGLAGNGGGNASSSGPVSFVSSSGPSAGGTPGVAIVGMEYATFADGNVGSIAGAVTYGSNSYITTPTATPSIGTLFEGGYYGGMLWQSLASSSTALTIANGTQVTLIVPAMQGNPMVYAGQTIKLVSLSTPNRFMQGTVAGAANGNLTLSVTSQSGSGNTHSDWVVMSCFRQIYAPKATGEATLAIAVGALPDGAWCLHEPRAVGAAMRAAGDATAFPAAHYVASLTIGGYSDWEVPTRDVLELVQRNLKSSSTNNYVTTDRTASPSKSYAVLGSQADVSASQGINTNTALIGTAYTTTSPARTSQALFQLPSGAQAFDSVVYGSSTAYDANSIWVQSLDTATTYGRQYTAPKATPVRVRAVRRSII